MKITKELLEKHGLDESDPMVSVLELQREITLNDSKEVLDVFQSLDGQALESQVKLLGKVGAKLDTYLEDVKSSTKRVSLIALGAFLATTMLNYVLSSYIFGGPLDGKIKEASSGGRQVYQIDISDSSKVEVNDNVVYITY